MIKFAFCAPLGMINEPPEAWMEWYQKAFDELIPRGFGIYFVGTRHLRLNAPSHSAVEFVRSLDEIQATKVLVVQTPQRSELWKRSVPIQKYSHRPNVVYVLAEDGSEFLRGAFADIVRVPPVFPAHVDLVDLAGALMIDKMNKSVE